MTYKDARKIGLKKGLSQLTLKQLYRVKDFPVDQMILDQFNYADNKFCPLAIGLELDKKMINPSHDKVFQELNQNGYTVYNTRGIKGDFYTFNRAEDLQIALQEVICTKERQQRYKSFILSIILSTIVLVGFVNLIIFTLEFFR